MCGIAGYETNVGSTDTMRGPRGHGFKDGPARAVGEMLQTMPWRGPDGRGVRTFATGALGHARLAIIDPSGGKQPIPNEDASLFLAMNGEIYNYRELRERLHSSHHLRTGSDSEVVLHLFEQEGPAMLQLLLGMYAIALRGTDGRLFLARDPLGIKPLYWGRDARGGLLYASEIKALLPFTAGVREFPPGAYYLSGVGLRRFRPVRALTRTPESLTGSVAPARRVLEQSLWAAVQRCLVADVPVGVFLSGGLDSSLVAALARTHVGPGLKSFAVGLAGSPDLVHARAAAAHIGTQHFEYAYTPDEVEAALPHVIYHLESYDPPLVRSAVATYFASQLAARHVKVVLTGEGADELLAGYHYLKSFPDCRAMNLECRRITAALHNTNLQRADRQSMAHSLEARVPFLELPVVSAAFGIDPGLKLGPDGKVEKWLLRKVAEAYLPTELVWRRKEKFSLGTGTGQLLAELAEARVSDALWARLRDGTPRLYSKEEYLYWQYFAPAFSLPHVVRRMGRARTLGDLDANPASALVPAG